jgi:hypothetical protein
MATVFSFCIYGPERPLYYQGLLENIELARRHFPGWKVYVYAGADVPESYLAKLQEHPNVVVRKTGLLGAANMIQRFFAIDELGIDTMFVRDADSRIHWKDRWAIRDFLNHPQYIAHTIRDHKEHTARMMGGLWALRKQSGLHMKTAYAVFQQNEVDHGVAHDQNFLIETVYPAVKSRLLVHMCRLAPMFVDEHVTIFPFDYTNDVYCGRVEDGFEDKPAPKSNQLLPFLRQVPTKVSRG